MRRAFLFVWAVLVPLAHVSAEPLTWADVVAMARANNPEWRAAQKNTLARRANQSGALNAFLPQVDLTSSYNTSNAPSRASRWGAGAQASLAVFDPSDWADMRTALAQTKQAEAQERLTSSRLMSALRSAYVEWLFAMEENSVSRVIRALRDRNAELVSLRYASGRESKGNGLRAQAEKLEAELLQRQAERRIQTAQEELRTQMGQADKSPSAWTAAEPISWSTPTPRPDHWDAMVEDHPTVVLNEARTYSARAGLSRSRSAFWPAVSATYARSFRGAFYFPDTPSWTASGVARWPLFGGGPTAALYDAKSAEYDLEKADADRWAARLRVRSDLESAWAAFSNADEDVRVQRAFLEAARQRNGEADVRYANGLMTYENWERIVNERVTYERGLIRAQRAAAIAEAQWHQAQGREIGESQ